jgi:hypothetical protein
MTREEFASLPVGIALSLLFDAHPGLAEMEKPKPAFPPKFDMRIRRKEGFMWASETDADGLKFWHDRAAKGADHPQYGQKNQKEAKALERWLKWRTENPQAQWTGERDHANVTAAPPASLPMVHEWQQRSPAPPGGIDWTNEQPASDGDFDDIPF